MKWRNVTVYPAEFFAQLADIPPPKKRIVERALS
jgi:hypothetical protein